MSGPANLPTTDTDPRRIAKLPQSVSPEARAALAAAAARPAPSFPDVFDREAWNAVIERTNADWTAMLSPIADLPGITDHQYEINGVSVFVCRPEGAPHGCAYMDIHGGGFVFLGGEAARLMARRTALQLGIEVHSVDYRMPPEHPYPAALDDCVTVYNQLLGQYGAEHLVVGGASAGANLAGALPLRLCDEGVALPAGLVLLTPAVDLTDSGDTIETNRDIDVVMPRSSTELISLYAGDNDLSHPYLSPLFGDFSAGYPPTFLQSGTRDLLLSNAVRMHRALRKSRVPTELHIFEAMPHGGFGGAPEDRELALEMRRFVHERLNLET